MERIITQTASHYNNNFSSSTVVGNVTTRKQDKLHSSNIPYLKILRFHFEKGNGCTYLTPETWLVELVRFGGKPLKPLAQKTLWAKMRRLGYVNHKRMFNNRNLRYVHYITQDGLKALSDWELRLKNHTSKPKKPYLEAQKTIPPFNHDQCNINHGKDEECLFSLTSMGIYKSVAKRLIKKYTDNQLYEVYSITKSNKEKIKKPGAYFIKLLQDKYGKVVSA